MMLPLFNLTVPSSKESRSGCVRVGKLQDVSCTLILEAMLGLSP